MRFDFAAVSKNLKQTAEDIGFGMILPEQSRGDRVMENTLFYPGTLLLGYGALTNDGGTALMACLSLAVLASMWADKGSKIRRGLETSKLFP